MKTLFSRILVVAIVYLMEPELESVLKPFRDKLYASGILPPISNQETVTQ